MEKSPVKFVAEQDRNPDFDHQILTSFVAESIGTTFVRRIDLPGLAAVTDIFAGNTEQGLRNPLINSGKLGIHTLAGIPLVFYRGASTNVLNNLIEPQPQSGGNILSAVLMHHLVEVISDKFEEPRIASAIARRLPTNMAHGFIEAHSALITAFNQSAVAIAKGGDVIPQFSEFAGLTIPLSGMLKTLLGSHPIFSDVTIAMGDADIVNSGLRANLIGVHNLRSTLRGSVFEQELESSIVKRYTGVDSTNYAELNPLQDTDLEKAITTRADSILTDVTILSLVSALANADPEVNKQLSQGPTREAVVNATRMATMMIGIANDLGGVLPFLLDNIQLQDILTSIMHPDITPREALQAVQQEHPYYNALFSLMKDARKQEHNLALDLGNNGSLSPQDQQQLMQLTVVKLRDKFQYFGVQLRDQLNLITSPQIQRGILAFIGYNGQIYRRGIDYDDNFNVPSLPIASGVFDDIEKDLLSM